MPLVQTFLQGYLCFGDLEFRSDDRPGKRVVCADPGLSVAEVKVGECTVCVTNQPSVMLQGLRPFGDRIEVHYETMMDSTDYCGASFRHKGRHWQGLGVFEDGRTPRARTELVDFAFESEAEAAAFLRVVMDILTEKKSGCKESI